MYESNNVKFCADRKFLFLNSFLMVFVLCAVSPNQMLAQSASKTKIKVQIKLSDELESEPVSGRLFLFFGKGMNPPMQGPNWFSPEPFFAKDVVDVKPGDVMTIDQDVKGCPGTFDDVSSGRWKIQAVLDHDFQYADHKNGPGNFYSDPIRVAFKNGEANDEISLELKNVIAPKKIEDTDRFKLVEYKSELLSEFHGRDVVDRAGVVLPASYDSNTNKRYPVYYEITGFGGTLRSVGRRYGKSPRPARTDEAEFIHVFLTGQCKWGHHVYADSATNGPRGEAFIKEMIPLIDSKFRTIAEPTARFVGGHSSGGWSSLWLQVTYPDSFGGCWSTAPDPVDFRDWQGTNIYAGESVFYEADGKTKKPLGRMNGKAILMYPDFCVMDDTLGRGGQLRSFEAVFSPLGDDGLPMKAWDRTTGIPNQEVIDYWKRYDISRTLQQDWGKLKDRLAGKINVFMGDMDTFYLEGATRLLGERVQEMGIDASVEMFPGKDHMNLVDPALKGRIMREMTEALRANHPEQ